jgi:AbrB family looped-hinge helix DNA binding protein
MAVSAISTKGWVVIPAGLRKKYNLYSGRRVALVDYGGILAIVPAMTDPVEEAAGILKGGPSLAGALLAERGLERDRER